MQEKDKVKKNNKVLYTILILFIIIIGVLVGVKLFQGNDTSVPISSATEETISIETPYCILEYPTETAEILKHVDVNENGNYSKMFYGIINDQEYELFTVSFCEKEGAVLIGYIMHEDTKYPVFVRSADIDKTLDDTTKNTLYTMQEGINNVIQSITSNENYLEE